MNKNVVVCASLTFHKASWVHFNPTYKIIIGKWNGLGDRDKTFSSFWEIYKNQVLQPLKVRLRGHRQLKGTGLNVGIKRVPTREIFTMEQWGKCFITVRNMENMLLKIVGSEINKIQTETIKNIKAIYYVPTLFFFCCLL